MRYKDRAKDVIADACGVLGIEPNADQAKQMADIVEKALMETILDERQSFVGAALNVCAPDKDKAHKFEEEMRHKHEALIANLQSLR